MNADASFYDVLIRSNVDSVERLYRVDKQWDETESNQYFWLKVGNASCDCNREMMFQEAGGEEKNWDSECGEMRYTIVKVILPNGTEILID